MTRRSISREEYLDRSLSRQQPWLTENISRRTWERRRLRERVASPLAASPDQAAVASQADDARLDEARAGVDAIYTKMGAERERRSRWWAQPVDDAPDRLTIRSVLSGETVAIHLDGDPKRERRQPAQAPRLWYEDAP